MQTSDLLFLSVARRKLPDMSLNPWDRLASGWPAIKVVYEDLGGKWGVTRWMSSGRVYIALDERLCQVERRVTLAHELEHLDRGRPCGRMRSAEEASVRAATARWLLPDLSEIGRTLCIYDLHRAADELWVTFPVLVDRMNNLSDSDSLYVHSFREDIA